MNRQEEIEEAKLALQDILFLINKAIEQINSAKNWGLFDIFAGGSFSSYIKRGKIKNINNLIRQIKDQLGLVQKELGDVDQRLDIEVSDTTFDNLFDIVFDNIFTDVRTINQLKDTENSLLYLQEELEIIYEKLEELE